MRVFGEMVDLLCERGARQAALRLEELWNELAARRRFSLLCGYHLDVFDPDVQASLLPDVCEAHSVVVPAKNYARFARAVERALDDVLGREEANRIYVRLVRDEQDHVPMAQRLLMWVSANMPSTAERVFSAARSHYAGALGS